MNNLELKETRYNQYFWNIIISIIFVGILFYVVSMSEVFDVRALAQISPFHFIIIALATFRLTRLLVADHITEWLRDLCMEKVFVKDPLTGATYMRCEKPIKGIRLIVSNLLGCPWCMGIWMALISLALYYSAIMEIFSLAWVILLIFAVAGAAEIIYASIVALMAPHEGGSYLVDQRGVNILSGQRRESAPNVCADCGVETK
ncbi:MAG: DUF1360 domain-containing protein [Candidatus Yonathbacteria bacterium]|nr:DUF1360 domain-containing protein [Candidatus Yonathbacteria bacterium]